MSQRPSERVIDPATIKATHLLNFQDAVVVTQIIEKTTKNGLFAASELASIGSVYNTLMKFIRESIPYDPNTSTLIQRNDNVVQN